MAESASLDPYRPPNLPEGPYAGRPTTGKPQLLSALCVICIVLGSLGIMNSLMGLVGALGGQQFQAMLQPKGGPGMPPEFQKANDDFQDDMNSVQNKYYVEIMISIGVRLLAAVLLVVGGFKALGLKESGRILLLAACAVALFFELGHSILQSLINTEMATAVNSFTEAMFQGMPQRKGQEAVGKTMQTFMQVMIYASFAIFYILTLAKAGTYFFGLIYLRKQKIKELFKPG